MSAGDWLVWAVGAMLAGMVPDSEPHARGMIGLRPAAEAQVVSSGVIVQ